VWASNATTIAGSPVGLRTVTSTGFHYVTDIWISNNSYIYMLDSGNLRVQLYLPGATSGITVINGSYGTGLNQFHYSN
jgi:hypothetical protein